MRKRVWAAICAAGLLGGLGVTAAPAQAAETDIVVNEVESNGDATDWVEFTNIGAEPVDISGWTFRDNDDTRGYVLPEGSVIEPGAFFGRYMPDTFWFDTNKTAGLDKAKG